LKQQIFFLDPYQFSNIFLFHNVALKIRKRELGDKHVAVASTLHNMGRICNEIENHETAMSCYSVALKIREIQLGKDDLEVAFTLSNIGTTHLHLSQHDKALKWYVSYIIAPFQKLHLFYFLNPCFPLYKVLSDH